MIPVNRLGWMAGVVDLKGRLSYKANAKRATPQVVLVVESREASVIRQLAAMTGTNPEQRSERPLKGFMRKGCSEHCPDAHVHVYEEGEQMMPPTSRWTVTGAALVVVLYNLMPYLTIDRGYVQAVKDVAAVTTLTGQGSGAVLRTLVRLHRLGWEMPEEYEPVVTAAIDGQE